MKLIFILTLFISTFSSYSMAAIEEVTCRIPSQNAVMGAKYDGRSLDYYIIQNGKKQVSKGSQYALVSQADAKSNEALVYASQKAGIDLNTVKSISVFVLNANHEGSMNLLRYNLIPANQKPRVVYFALSTVINCQ